MSALQSRAADSVNLSSTACKSNVDRLITLSTSAVAVCCRRDRDSSRLRFAISFLKSIAAVVRLRAVERLRVLGGLRTARSRLAMNECPSRKATKSSRCYPVSNPSYSPSHTRGGRFGALRGFEIDNQVESRWQLYVFRLRRGERYPKSRRSTRRREFIAGCCASAACPLAAYHLPIKNPAAGQFQG